METKGREGGRGGLPCPAARSTAARVRRLGGSRRAYAERCLRGGGKMRLSLTRDERTEAVVRIVRRRQRASVRVREERRRTPPDRAAARCRSRLRRNPPKTADTPVQRLSRPMRQGGSDSPRRGPQSAYRSPQSAVRIPQESPPLSAVLDSRLPRGHGSKIEVRAHSPLTRISASTMQTRSGRMNSGLISTSRMSPPF